MYQLFAQFIEIFLCFGTAPTCLKDLLVNKELDHVINSLKESFYSVNWRWFGSLRGATNELLIGVLSVD